MLINIKLNQTSNLVSKTLNSDFFMHELKTFIGCNLYQLNHSYFKK